MASSLAGNETNFRSKRDIRNMSEKKRRDAFNGLIGELRSLVAGDESNLDKSNILQKTIGFLRSHNEQKPSSSSDVENNWTFWKPDFLTKEEYSKLLMNGNAAFSLAFTNFGHIVYVSKNAQSIIGKSRSKALSGASIFDIVDSEGKKELQQLFNSCRLGKGSPATIQKVICCFNIEKTNLNVELLGQIKPVSTADLPTSALCPQGIPLPDASIACFTGIAKVTSSAATCKPPEFIADQRASASKRLQSNLTFSSRLSCADFRFIEADQRSINVLGYESFELLGKSIFEIVHGDDLKLLEESLKLALQSGHADAVAYRLLSKGNMWIPLKTSCYVTYNDRTSKPDFLVCASEIITENDLKESLAKTTSGTQKRIEKTDRRNSSGKQRKVSNNAEAPLNVQEMSDGKKPIASTNLPGVSIVHAPIEMKQHQEEPIPLEVAIEETSPPVVSMVAPSSEDLLRMELLRRQLDLEREIRNQEQQLRSLRAQLLPDYANGTLLAPMALKPVSASPVLSLNSQISQISPPLTRYATSSSFSPAALFPPPPPAPQSAFQSIPYSK